MLYWCGVSWRLLVLLASPAISLVLAFSNSSGLWGVWFLLMLALVIWYKPYVVEGVIIVVANIVMGVVALVFKPGNRRRLLIGTQGRRELSLRRFRPRGNTAAAERGQHDEPHAHAKPWACHPWCWACHPGC